jgi:hypothetical protein
MRHLTVSALLILAFSFGLSAAEKHYQNAVILKVEQKTHTRILYWVVDTPITQDDPYYEITAQLANLIYIAQYAPMHHADTSADEWSAGSKVQARVAGGHLILKRTDGTDVELAIIKRKASPPAEQNPQPAPVGKGWES